MASKVPETQLKARKRNQERKAAQVEAAAKQKVARRQLKVEALKRAEKYVKEYRDRERGMINARRQAKDNRGFYREPEAKLAFVIRIRGINGVDPRTRKILQLLRLRQVHNGVFVRLNKASLNMLRLVEPYVAYGYPSLKTVRELVYKRGFARVSGQRIPITSNALIQRHLGKYDIICVEDLVHEIYTVGPHFKQANHFLWHFKLSNPKGGFNKITTHFIEGGDAGNREQYINQLVHKMN
eukprot:CAMPEP_0201546132 /NCGR_PEP_ID=MMETSP0173_2-20130828/2512_1 /ASSEMBLY_ACC=CAM_ASM_000268 /TAXON_ID=218659 /ORGANISM="Vexillifera sp., Strain DIVA3 564/2" /LENGTH=239 /DNA_ID=CAMNT_0047954731 /DNA_START=640 /DNA_END=1359 /DNA_ORIENTATION=+